jgi:UDP-N-acetylglucosamine--N-acetylmuramyl-(pentapeptide) pyrophosphoryl-undecaprenol N-acetylglucosamine transferase
MGVKINTVLIAGGGTGGHLSPGIALYEEFTRQGTRALFLAGKKDLQFSSLNDIASDDLLLYGAPGLTRNIFKMPYFVLAFAAAVIRAIRYIRKYDVGAVIGMGGYVSAPALIAARMRKVPIYLCEQNSVPGKVTRSFEKYACRVYGTFAGAREYLREKGRFVHAGNPIRQKVLAGGTKEEARKTFHLDQQKKVILAIGGSQGALKINELIFGLKKRYPEEFKNIGILWSTGSLTYERFKKLVQDEMEVGAVYLSPFLDRVGLAYAASDIAISRSGAGVMMELAAMGVPSIQIPYPFAAMDHQDKNADDFVREGAAVKISNEDAVPEKVGPVLFGLLNNERALRKMSERASAAAKREASEVIVRDILSAADDAGRGKL